MEPSNIKTTAYIKFNVNYNEKKLNFKVTDKVRISYTKLFLQKTTL